jgi:hypothetical protein
MTMLEELAKLTREELRAFMASGAFTGFGAEEMAHANGSDKGKMEAFNEALRLIALSKGLQRRQGQ